MILALLLWASSARAYEANGLYSQQTCVAQFAADKTAVANWTVTFTPTLTATLTPIATYVTNGTTRRIFSVGNSHWSAGNCVDASEYDGPRPGFLAAYKSATGGLGYYVGSYLKTYPTPLVQDSYTNAVGASYSTDAFVMIRDNLAGQIGTPNSNDRIMIMSAANDAKNGWTSAQEKASAYASCTMAASVDGLAKIWLCTDFHIKIYDTTAVSQGVRDAYTQLRADGYSQVYLIDTENMVTWNPTTYTPDYCADPDPGHLTLTGFNKLGGAMVASLQASGGL